MDRVCRIALFGLPPAEEAAIRRMTLEMRGSSITFGDVAGKGADRCIMLGCISELSMTDPAFRAFATTPARPNVVRIGLMRSDRGFTVTPELVQALALTDIILTDVDRVALLLRAHIVDPSNQSVLCRVFRDAFARLPENLADVACAAASNKIGSARVQSLAIRLGVSRWTVRRRSASATPDDLERLIKWSQLLTAIAFREIGGVKVESSARYLGFADWRPIRRLARELVSGVATPSYAATLESFRAAFDNQQ
jgi:hypothetical protein